MNATILTRALATAGAIVATAALLAAPAYAQAQSAPLSRAAVNAETRAANLAWQLLPAGELIDVKPQTIVAAQKTRTERKAETLAAAKQHQLLPAGEAVSAKPQAVVATQKTRAERKAETLEAARQHKLLPAGEAAYPQS